MKNMFLVLVLVGVLAGCASYGPPPIERVVVVPVVPTQSAVVVPNTITEGGYTTYRVGPPPVVAPTYYAPAPIVVAPRPTVIVGQPYVQYGAGGNQYYRQQASNQQYWLNRQRERNRHEYNMTREENRRRDEIRDDIRDGLNDWQRARQQAQGNNNHHHHNQNKPVMVNQERPRIVQVNRDRNIGRQESGRHVRQMPDRERRRN